VADISGTVVEQQPFFEFVNPGIEIPVHRQLRRGLAEYGGAGEVRHAVWA
jgi:hypothetical protein